MISDVTRIGERCGSRRTCEGLVKGFLAVTLLAAWATAASAAVNLRPQILNPRVMQNQSVGLGDVNEGCAAATTGRTLIRFALRTRNVGSTDLVLGNPGCMNCTMSTEPPSACTNPNYICSHGHGHPHFTSFAKVELLNQAGQVVHSGRKVGFCVLDLECAHPQFDCGFQGLSAGCSDVYDKSLPCQYLDISNLSLAPGNYTLRVTSDPDGLIPEGNEGDNVDTATIGLGPCDTAPTGASCDDGNICTSFDACQADHVCRGTCGAGASCGAGGCDMPCLMASDPAAVSWDSGRLDVFWKGGDSALWHMWFDGDWFGPENLGGTLKSGPAVASWAPGRLDVFWRANNDELNHKWWGGFGWSVPESLGGNMGGPPNVISWGPNRLDIFFRGGGGGDNLRHIAWNGSAWSGIDDLGGTLANEPAAITWGVNHLDAFWRGSDNALKHKWFNGTSWSGIEDLGGSLVSPPAPIAWAPGRIDVFWRNSANDMKHKWFDGAWSANEDLGGNMTSPPSPISWFAGHLDVFWKGNDNALKHIFYSGGWSTIQNLGGAMTSQPVAVTWGMNHIDVFSTDNSGRLQHHLYLGTWFPPQPLF